MTLRDWLLQFLGMSRVGFDKHAKAAFKPLSKLAEP